MSIFLSFFASAIALSSGKSALAPTSLAVGRNKDAYLIYEDCILCLPNSEVSDAWIDPTGKVVLGQKNGRACPLTMRELREQISPANLVKQYGKLPFYASKLALRWSTGVVFPDSNQGMLRANGTVIHSSGGTYIVSLRKGRPTQINHLENERWAKAVSLPLGAELTMIWNKSRYLFLLPTPRGGSNLTYVDGAIKVTIAKDLSFSKVIEQ